jgi:hypothetical protein
MERLQLRARISSEILSETFAKLGVVVKGIGRATRQI